MIIAFAYIQFKSHKSLISFRPRVKRVESFIGYKNVVYNQPTRNKGALGGKDYIMKNQLESVSQDLGNDFVKEITKAYQSEITNFELLLDFGYKSDNGVVYGFQNTFGIHIVQHKLTNILVYSMSIFLVKTSRKAIWFEGPQRKRASLTSTSMKLAINCKFISLVIQGSIFSKHGSKFEGLVEINKSRKNLQNTSPI